MQWPTNDEEFDQRDIGMVIRIFLHWPMSRPQHPRSLLAVHDHLQAPFCMLHAAMRITEKMLEFLQVRGKLLLIFKCPVLQKAMEMSKK